MTTDTVRAPAEASRRPSRGLRQLVPWLLALAVATCTQDNVGPSRGGVGYFSFRPDYPLAQGVSLSQFGIVADSVHIVLTRPVNELVLDTTVAFPADSNELRLALPVELATSPEVLDALIEISAGGVVIFRDSLQVTVKDGAPGNTPPPVVSFDYVGPGSNIATLSILPGDTTITLGDTLFFTATAIDSSDASVANFYVGWKTSDTAVARINAAGRLIAPLLRGTIQVIGLTPTGISDTTTVTFAPVPVIITADSGGGQVGVVGDSLGALFVARVKGADSLGISGIPVRFQAVVGGGSVRDTVVITDAQGRARTRGVLGTSAVTNNFSATALGTGLTPAVFIAGANSATATAIAIFGGNAQVDTIGKVLAQPLVVRVTDAFTNPVSGAVVVFTRTTGTGLLADDSVTTDATGLASVAYTLGGTAGVDSIHALLAGTSAFVDFSVTAVAALPTQIIQGLGDGQSAVVNTSFTDSLTVQVLDAGDNPVSGVWVHWLVTSGGATLSADSTQTDALGHTAVALTAGTLANAFTVEASVAGIALPLVFNETVTAGAPASMVIASGNGQSGPAGVALPLWPEARVTDAFNNPVAGVSVDFAVVAGGGSIDSATATTDSTGRANSGAWTLGLAGLNTVRATSAAVPADTLLFDATATPAGTTKLWTGASTGAWTDANSWSPVGVPGITDNVFIPASAPDPLLSASTTIAGLTVESGATLIADALFTVSGDADIGGNITGSGGVTLSGSGGTLRGTIGNPVVNVTGNRSLSGTTTISGALNVTGGSFSINGQTLTVGGNMTVSGGQLGMGSGTDSVDVTGNFTISTGTTGSGSLSTGVMVLRGNFTQTVGSTTNFAPSGTHTVRFLGSGTQTVTFGSPGSANSRFQNVEFGSATGTTLGSTFTAMGIVTANAGTVTGIGRTANIGGGLVTSYATWQVSTTLWGQDPSVYPDSLPRNVTAFNAWTLTKPFKADSNLVINNTGVLTLNGHTLRIGGTVTQGGVLRMQNTGDTLDVGQLFTVNSGTTGSGDLTGGVLRLRGGFTQNVGSTSNFQPSGSHVTRFEGVAGQTAAFGSAGAVTSRFQNLELADSVNFTSAIYVAGSTTLLGGGKAQSANTATLAGPLTDPTNLGWRFASTSLSGTVTSLPDSLVTNVTLLGNWALTQRTRVTGTFTVNSGASVDLNGDTLVVSGSFTQGGAFLSAAASGLLDVGGPFLVNSGTSGTGALSAGHLVMHQGFTQNVGSNSNFVAGAGFLTTFAGTGGHTMSFSSPGVGGSVFSALEVFDSLTVSGSFTTTGDITLDPAGRIVGVGTGTLLGGLADPSGLGYRMAGTTIPGGQVIPGAMTTNLTLTGAWTLPAAFTLTGNLALNSGADLNTNGHRLYVSGSMVQGGILRMLLPADTVEVNGLLTVNSGSDGTGHLVDGRLLLHAGLTQNVGSTNNFKPSGGHLTEFAGSGGHPLSVSSFSAANSHFQHLVVRDSLTVSGNIAVVGDVTLDPTGRLVGPGIGILLGDLADSSLAGWRMVSTQLNGKFQSIPSALVTNVTLTDSIALAQNTSVTGNFTLQNAGYIAFSSHGLGVSGNFTQNAELGMNSTQDSLDVGGLFTVNSGSDGTGDLSAGVIVLRGGMTQTVGSTTNFMSDAPHRVRFTGSAARAIDLSTPNLVHFGDLEIDASGAITFNTDVHANGSFTVAGGPVAITAAAQRLLRVQDLSVDGLSLDRVRLEMHGSSNAATVNNVTFTNIDPALDQLSLELPGQTGDTLKFTNVSFSGVPTTGHYVFVADSVANDAPAVIGFYNSTPLNGALYTAVEGTVGDPATILWTHLDWVTQPTDAVELLPIVSAPQVGVYDPSNVLVSGFSGTIVLGLATDPSGGNAVLAGNSVAAAGGVATFDSLTVSLAGVGYTLVAGHPQVGQSPASLPFTISIPLPVGTTTSFNNGGGDNLWENAANWTAGIPDSTDNVYIFPGQTAAVNAPAQVNRMIVGTGGGVLLNAPLTADSSVDAGNTITGGGQLVARGTGFLSGVAGGLVVTGNYLVPTGDTLVADYINISGATAVLDPGPALIVAIDSLRTEAGGALNVNNGGAVVRVQGRARFTGGPSGFSIGTLEIGGDFSQEENVGAFSPAPGFTTVFNGGGTQTASFFSPDTLSDRFGNLTLTGGGTLHLAGATVPVVGGLDIQGGTVVIDTAAYVRGPVTGSTGAFLQGALLQVASDLGFGGVFGVANVAFVGTGMTILPQSAPYDTVSVLGTALLGGDVTANAFWVYGAGQFLMNGHRLDVTGDFGTGGSGQFAMTSPADTLIVGGTFYAMGGSTNGLLTDGLLQITGSFYQGSTPADTIPVEVQGPPPAFDGFRATGTHVTRFVGAASDQRTIFFGSPVLPADPFSTSNSRFGVLQLANGFDSLASTIPVDGDLTVDTAHVINAAFLTGGPAVGGNILVGPNVAEFTVSNVSLGGALDFQATPALYQVGTTLFFGNGQTVPVLPYQDIEIAIGQATLAGDVSANSVKTGVANEGPGIPGDLRLGGHTLTLAGDFRTTGQGTFTMDDPADSLDVGGNTDLGGGVTTALTAGTMVVRGDLYLQDSSLVASGTHKAVFAAAAGQQLWITTSPVPANQFNRVTVLAGTTVNFNAFQVGPMVVADTFWVNGFFLQANPGKTIIALGDLYAGVAAGITVDTVELHKDLEISASGYSTQLTRYAGTAQVLRSNVSYNDVEITGSAVLDTTFTTVVGRDLTVRGNGSLDLSVRELDVGRTFRTLDSGTVTSVFPSSTINADTAEFNGGSTAGLLTDGLLRVRALLQGNSTSDFSFTATGNHTTQIGTTAGGAEYRIQMATGGNGTSRIKNLLLADGGVGGVPTRLVGRITVNGKLLTVSEGSGGIIGDPGAFLAVFDSLTVQDPATDIAIDTLELYGGIQIPGNTLASTVVRFMIAGQQIPDSQSYQGIEIWGDVSPEPAGHPVAASMLIKNTGRLTLGASQSVTLSGDFTTAEFGSLAMTDPTADLFIGGNATFAGGSLVGQLTGGNIRVAGNFTELPGSTNETFTSNNTGVQFLGSSGTQVVTLDPATIGNFRAIGVTNPNGIQINGLMIVTDSVGTSGPITGDSLYQFGNFFLNSGAQVSLKVLKTSGLLSGTPSVYAVGRTHIMNANTLPNVPFDTLVINANGVSAFYPLTANVLYVAGPGSSFASGPDAFLDLGGISSPVAHTILGDVHVEGTGAHLRLAEDTLALSGSFSTDLGGTLEMADANGLLQIGDSANFGGGSQIGLLTAGMISVNQHLTQTAATSPSSFRMDGAVLAFTDGVQHGVRLATPDSSWLPDLNPSGSGTLSLYILGRARIAGGVSAYGIDMAGDTLITDGQLAAGPTGLTVNLRRYEGPVMNQFQNVTSWSVYTTQFTGPGALPFQDFNFDTLLVSDSVIGQLSQLLKANYVEVTGPGNPKHIGDEPGVLVLSGGDGNTTLDVTGNVLVRGFGAGIANQEGFLQATGDLTVDQNGYLTANGSFGGGNYVIDGNVVFDGASTKDSLVQGSLQVGGKFTQLATTSAESFAPDSLFTTQFKFAGTHTVSFATPSPAGGGGSHFGGLSFSADAGLVMETDTDLWVEGILSTQSFSTPILRNTAAVLRTINVQDVAIQGVTFDHLQLRVAKTTAPASSAGSMSSVTFSNFLTTEDQFLVDLPGTSAQFNWGTFTFTPLSTGDSGHYLVATDTDGGVPDVLTISLGTNNWGVTDPPFYVGLNGAIISPFAP